MKIEKHILNAQRLRRVPLQFSWIDHRLIRCRYLLRAPANAWALYLALVSAGDEHGLSYYSEGSLGRLLSLAEDQIAAARRQLVAADVVAYENPLYQVLSLEGELPGETRRKGATP